MTYTKSKATPEVTTYVITDLAAVCGRHIDCGKKHFFASYIDLLRFATCDCFAAFFGRNLLLQSWEYFAS